MFHISEEQRLRRSLARQELERQAQCIVQVVLCAAKLGLLVLPGARVGLLRNVLGGGCALSPVLLDFFDGCDFGVETWHLGCATVDIIFFLYFHYSRWFCIFLSYKSESCMFSCCSPNCRWFFNVFQSIAEPR